MIYSLKQAETLPLFDEPEQLGPEYRADLDKARLSTQFTTIRDYMVSQARVGRWLTLGEINAALGYPEASISAQLRHLRKPSCGSYQVDKRRRGNGGNYEYYVTPKT